MSTWPAVMRVPSPDIKRCLTGNGEAKDNRTLYKALEELGYDRNIRYIVTEELEQRIKRMQTSSGQQLSYKTIETNDESIKQLLR